MHITTFNKDIESSNDFPHLSRKISYNKLELGHITMIQGPPYDVCVLITVLTTEFNN